MKAIDVLNETYEIIEEIGSGGGGVVYHAIHKRLQTDVVVKRIKDEMIGKVQSRREADVLKKLKHPYLPRVYDFLETDEGIYTVMDYIKGKNLDVALKEHGKFSQAEVRKWAVQLGEALDYLHRQNPVIIHSDIKPANIMLTPEGDVCLIDFNISLAMGNTEETAVGISVGFSPPEQYRDPELYARITHNYAIQGLNELSYEKTELLSSSHQGKRECNSEYMSYFGKGISTKSDIYSLGMCLFTLLTGDYPNRNFSNQVCIESSNNTISEGFAAIINQMIRINPDERFCDGTEYLEAIRNCHKLDHKYIAMHRKEIALRFASLVLIGMGITIGTVGIVRNKTDKASVFYSAIEDINVAIESGHFVHAEELIALAKENYNNVAIYKEELYAMYVRGDYTACIEAGEALISTQPFYIETAYDKSQFGEIFYLIGSSYYEQNDNAQAERYFEQAISYCQDNPYFLRDYAIALAKNQKMDAAYAIMTKAEKLGLDTASIELIKGEMAYSVQNYDEAVNCFEKVIDASKDGQVVRRALLICSDAFWAMGKEGKQKAIDLLESKMFRVDSSNQMVIKSKLADSYVVLAQSTQGDANLYYEKALEIYESMREVGYVSLQLLCNIGVIYENMGELESAEEAYKEVVSLYPNRYEGYMQLAFWEADRQQKVEFEHRDYQAMKGYYEIAWDKYDKSIQDSRMIMLDKMMNDIIEGGWLTE